MTTASCTKIKSPQPRGSALPVDVIHAQDFRTYACQIRVSSYALKSSGARPGSFRCQGSAALLVGTRPAVDRGKPRREKHRTSTLLKEEPVPRNNVPNPVYTVLVRPDYPPSPFEPLLVCTVVRGSAASVAACASYRRPLDPTCLRQSQDTFSNTRAVCCDPLSCDRGFARIPTDRHSRPIPILAL